VGWLHIIWSVALVVQKTKENEFIHVEFECPICGYEMETIPVNLYDVERRLFEHVWWAHLRPSRCWCGFQVPAKLSYERMREHVAAKGGVATHWLEHHLDVEVSDGRGR
jgi:hypothetical protein